MKPETSFGHFLLYAVDSDEKYLNFIGWVFLFPIGIFIFLTFPIWIIPVALWEWLEWKKENV